jgi:hypothetical protein
MLEYPAGSRFGPYHATSCFRSRSQCARKIGLTGFQELPSVMDLPGGFLSLLQATTELRREETFAGAACFRTFRPD